MKHFLLFLSLLTGTIGHTQQFRKDSLKYYSFEKLYSFFSESQITDVETCKDMGLLRARYDIERGKRFVLSPVSMAPHPCVTCSYQQIGYTEVGFGSDRKVFETAETFRRAYNEIMISLMTEDQKQKLASEKDRKPFSFDATIAGSFTFNIKQEQTDLVRMKFHSDTLESLFPLQLDNILVEIRNGTAVTYCNYSEIRTNGAIIGVGDKKQLSLTVTFDFRDIVALEDLCWCSNVNQRHSFQVPLILQ